MNFYDILNNAKQDNQDAIYNILNMYKPLLMKESIVDGVWDEDLFQDLILTLINCIKKFEI